MVRRQAQQLPPYPAVVIGDEGISTFGERLLAVIDEGRRISSYKLALLLALIDVCAENPGFDGRAPSEVPRRLISKRVAELYWPQVEMYWPEHNLQIETIDLKQIRAPKSALLEAVKEFARTVPGLSFNRAAAADLQGFERMISRVDAVIRDDPLPRLQTVNGVSTPFIYDIDGRTVRFRNGAGDHLVRLASLVRPLVELHWVRLVAELNDLALNEEDLHDHLFGAERKRFSPVLREGLAAFQDGCFYCEGPLQATSAHLDHFIPWARYPNDAVENLVLAHDKCNGLKSNRLAGTLYLSAWCNRFRQHRNELGELARHVTWETAPQRSIGLVQSIYSHLPSGAPLWHVSSGVEFNDPRAVQRVLRNCRA